MHTIGPCEHFLLDLKVALKFTLENLKFSKDKDDIKRSYLVQCEAGQTLHFNDIKQNL